MIGINPHDIKRFAGCQPQSATLADRVMDDTLMGAKHAAVEMHNLASFCSIRPQPFDHIRVTAIRHEADILTVMLFGNRKAEFPRQCARFRLSEVAERKPQQVKLLARGRVQKIALIAIGVSGAIKCATNSTIGTTRNVMPRRQGRRAKFACRRQQIAEFDRAITFDTRDRCFALQIGFDEIVDDGIAKAAFIIEHVMRYAQMLGHTTRIVNVLPGAACANAMNGLAMIVKLQRDANDVVTGALHQPRHHGRVDAARHRNDNAMGSGISGKIKRGNHGCVPRVVPNLGNSLGQDQRDTAVFARLGQELPALSGSCLAKPLNLQVRRLVSPLL